ncbi:uncharacterized protein [Haliotis asinina]|uniref:uncharacterized protein n=1 Tax=Haliotis asinina TaxID=109174 RepID=UPI003531C264
MANLFHVKTFSNSSVDWTFGPPPTSLSTISGPHNAAAELWGEHLKPSDKKRINAAQQTRDNNQGSPVEAYAGSTNAETSANAGSHPFAPVGPPTFVGHTIKGYYFESIINSGGWGLVYRVRKEGVIYAAKVSLHKANDDSFAVRTWLNEYDILSSIDHPNFLKVYDLFRYDMKMVMIMEYFEGYDMIHFIRNFSLTWRQKHLKGIAKQLMTGLEYLHSKNIVHRDIKPENILIGPGNNAKIIDFGGAIDFEVHQTPQERHVTCSTSYYAPPEIHRGDARASSDDWIKSFDIWSMGVTLYGAIAGQYPFEIDSDRRIRASVFEKGPDYSVLKGTDSKLLSLMRKCLDTDPSSRITARRALQHRYFWRGPMDAISFGLLCEHGRSGNTKGASKSSSSENGHSGNTKRLLNPLPMKMDTLATQRGF